MSLRLDTNSPVPLHHQLQSQLRAAIVAGEYAPGDFLPGEMELVSITGVSRPTVRQAIERLARDGLVRRQRGRKTVVLQPAQQASVYMLNAELPRRAASACRVLSVKRSAPSEEAVGALSLGPRAEIIEIERVKLVDDKPVALERIMLPAHRVVGIEADGPPPLGAFYATLERRYGLIATAAEEVVELTLLDEHSATSLGLKAGVPALSITRRTLAGETPIEWRTTTLPAAGFRGSATLGRAELDID